MAMMIRHVTLKALIFSDATFGGTFGKCLSWNKEKESTLINCICIKYNSNTAKRVPSIKTLIETYLIRRMVLFLRNHCIHPQCNNNNPILQQHTKAEHTLPGYWQGILHVLRDYYNRTNHWLFHCNGYHLGIPVYYQNPLVSTKGKSHLLKRKKY